jgi:hypothetical protein
LEITVCLGKIYITDHHGDASLEALRITWDRTGFQGSCNYKIMCFGGGIIWGANAWQLVKILLCNEYGCYQGCTT